MILPCVLLFPLFLILVQSQKEDGGDTDVYLLVKINSYKNDIYNRIGIQSQVNHNKTYTPKDQGKKALQKMKEYTKIAVAMGVGPKGSYDALDTIEVINIASSSLYCKNLPNFPNKDSGVIGGLKFGDIPIICGGENSRSCHSFVNGSWKPDVSLKQSRYLAAVSRSPFPNDQSTLFVTGGSGLDSSEVLTKEGWELSTPLPLYLKAHCMVRMNATSALIVGGIHGENSPPDHLSDRTFILNGETKIWTEGPRIKRARRNHRCAMIKKDSESQAMSVIVVGGDFSFDDYVGTLPTEVLDLESSEWKSGPELPEESISSTLVELPSGGVVLIGDLNFIYSLDHAGSDARWEEMPQKLKTRRDRHTAFLIPDELTSCF